MENIYQLVNEELDLINTGIKDIIANPIPLINDISNHTTITGGKKLRSLTVLLSAKCFDSINQNILDLATVIEFFHISSLLHDDVIDNANTRRGHTAAHMIWGNKASILVGDYIFSKAFQLLAKIHNQRILTILANTSNIITQGEIQQLLYVNNPDISIEQYIEIIHHKTAVLFEAATQMGPILANAEEEDINAMAQFGHYLGRAFQIIDDILDYSSSSSDLGKQIGNDLGEGKITIPLIYAIQESSIKEKNLIKQAIQNSSYDKLDQIIEIINKTDAIALSRKLAVQQIDHAVTHLLKIANSTYRDALEELAEFVLSRSH